MASEIRPARPSSLKSISFAEPTEDSYHPAPKPISSSEEAEHHDAQEDFISKRASHICSLVFAIVFIIVSSVLFWAGSHLNLKDLTILGSIFFVFGVVLFIVSFILLFRAYRRAKRANTRIFDREFVPKKSVVREDTSVTQSDVTIRGLSPVQTENRRPTHHDLYSNEAIKSSDINKFEAAVKKQNTQTENERSQSRTVIQLSDNRESPNEDVVIIHDARIALPNPVYSESNYSNNSNSTTVVFTLETQPASELQLPGTPDLSREEHSDNSTDIPQAFDYVDPHKNSTNL